MPNYVLEGKGTGWGTCGELAQGRLPDGRHFHITCPIHKSSSARVSLDYTVGVSERGVFGLDGTRSKAREALRKAAQLLEVHRSRIEVSLWSDLEIAKGMGSSTADICAVIRALVMAAKCNIEPEQIAQIAATIESSDGTMYPGINMVDHKTGQLLWDLRPKPSFTILMLVPDNIYSTDSISFHGQDNACDDYTPLIEMIGAAQTSGDPHAWGQIATWSARHNQQWLPNTLFELLEDRYEQLGAVGINIGHTGTMAGLLYTDDETGRRAAARAWTSLPDMQSMGVHLEIVRTAQQLPT